MVRGILLPLEWCLYAIGSLVLFLKWMIWEKSPQAWRWIRGQQKAPPTHGNAGFAGMKEMKADGHLTPGGFLIGVKEKKRVFTLPEACVHFFGKRGEGKSQTFAANLNYICELEKKPDILIGDPAGEHLGIFGPKMKAAGFDLLILDLDNPASNAGYNALSPLANSTQFSIGSDVEAITSLAMPEIDEHASSQHFIDAAHGVLAALIDWEYQQKVAKAEFHEAIRLLTTADEPERDKVLALIQTNGSDTAKAGINVYLRVKEREKGSFNSTIGRKLRIFNDPSIKAIMKPNGSPWTWEDVFNNPKPVGVFVIGGAGDEKVSGAFNRLVIGQCIDAVKRYYSAQGRKRLQKGLRVFVDEADTLGYCKPMLHAVTQLRKHGVNVFMCWQSIGQIVTNFGGERKAQPMIDGCDWIITGGLKDEKLYGTVSRLLGDFTGMSKSESLADHGKSEGKHETARPLMKIDELKSMRKNRVVVLADRLNLLHDLPYESDEKTRTVKYL
ncbi:type IV secretory system conjugative DNA transfer family protein [Bradyrhizobium sp.]|uniref:type IV secretory system conjugative DNA transfer family protein n=1 Tax=Bradyrhizobium sp. TaxID=376 RepID=UPI0027348E6A|nr:type IV secretory system conjugative DNA transfer family protein [Bradyrhizobium sp.]MDP3078700.1 type IV secretory system conjugative DNA transfer family protein [Bradyrhizobium sp.]